MNIPENHLHKLIDGLTHSNACLALYRLPWKEQPVLVLQREGNPDTYARLQDLNGKTGFVLAPFHADNRQPIVLIRPDRQRMAGNQRDTGRLGKCLGGNDSAKQ